MNEMICSVCRTLLIISHQRGTSFFSTKKKKLPLRHDRKITWKLCIRFECAVIDKDPKLLFAIS